MKKALIPMLAVLALPAFAADDAQKPKPGNSIDLPYLMAPLTGADGKLTGYAYIAARLTASSEGLVTAVRDRLPFIQDAMVRDVNATAVTTADDPEKVDIPAVEQRLLGDAVKVMGAGKVRRITVCTVQIAELHPIQTPALHTPPAETDARGKPLKNPVKSRCES